MHIAALPPSDRVSAEFTGQSRMFRSRVLAWATPAGLAHRQIYTDALRTFKRRTGALRPETLISIERAWRATCNNPDCLDIAIRRDQRTIDIRDTRCTAATIDYVENDDEVALSIFVASLSIGVKTLAPHQETIAAISIHALARRMQRGFGAGSDAAILLDLRAMAIAAPDLPPDRPFVVETPSGGTWRGTKASMIARGEGGITRQIANCRTFV